MSIASLKVAIKLYLKFIKRNLEKLYDSAFLATQ